MWEFLLGCIVTVVLGIVTNLLTPGVPTLTRRLWQGIRNWQHRGEISRLQKELKEAQVAFDLHIRLTTGTDRELFLYLFRWTLSIVTVFVLAAALAYLSVTLNIPAESKEDFGVGALLCILTAVTMSAVILNECRHLTAANATKHRDYLQTRLDRARAKPPPD